MKQMTRDEQKAEILQQAKRAMVPLLIGPVASSIGHYARLEAVEAILEEMCEEGVLRRITKEESWKHGIQHGYVLKEADPV